MLLLICGTFQQREQLGESSARISFEVCCHNVTMLTTKFRFKGAYCTVLEMEALTDLFGDMDVIDATLPGMADKIIASQAAA